MQISSVNFKQQFNAIHKDYYSRILAIHWAFNAYFICLVLFVYNSWWLVNVIVKRIEQFLKSNKNPEKMEKGANSQNIHYMFNNLLKKKLSNKKKHLFTEIIRKYLFLFLIIFKQF